MYRYAICKQLYHLAAKEFCFATSKMETFQLLDGFVSCMHVCRGHNPVFHSIQEDREYTALHNEVYDDETELKLSWKAYYTGLMKECSRTDVPHT